MRLSPAAEAAGYRLTALDQTGSTNDEALAAARAGDPGRHWFVAGRQSAGRGRHGRAWASPAGNLHASLLLVDPCAAASAPQLGFVAGLALHDAVADLARLEAGRLALKWPNDLLLDGAKLAGLLLEGQFVQPGNAFAVVIGIGVNVATAPDGAPYPTRAVAEVAPAATAAALLERLGAAFARRFERWHAAQGAPPAFASVRAEWLARAAGVGGRVTLRLPSGEREGAFRGLDPSGRLELDTPSGVEVIDAGDLYFPTLDASPAPRPAT